MSIKILLILIITLVLMAAGANGNPTIKQMFTQQYDNSGTALDKCSTCMRTTAPASWNPYGTALRNDPDFDGNNPARAFENIEQLDSDGDGFSNIDEIRSSTFPGDPDDFPEVMQETESPAVTATQTEMATRSPMPSPANENTANSMFNALAALIAVIMMSVLVGRKNG